MTGVQTCALPIYEEISTWLRTEDALTGDVPIARDYLRVGDVAKDCLRIDARNMKRVEEMQIGKVLRLCGLTRKRKRVEGGLAWVFVPTVPT